MDLEASFQEEIVPEVRTENENTLDYVNSFACKTTAPENDKNSPPEMFS